MAYYEDNIDINEEIDDESEFDDDDLGLSEYEQAEFDAFIEYLRQKEEEYFSEPKIRIINPKRLKEFQYSLMKITNIIKEASPDAEIEYTLNTEANIGNAAIDIKTDTIIAYDTKMFSEATKFANNFEIYPLKNGDLRMSMMFHGMLDEIEKD